MSKFRLTIGRKIGAGFAILIILTIGAFIATLNTIKTSRRINDEINNIYTPSVNKLELLNQKVVNANRLMQIWLYGGQSSTSAIRPELKRLLSPEYPTLKKEILEIGKVWDKEKQDNLIEILQDIDNLFEKYEQYTNQYTSFSSMQDESGSQNPEVLLAQTDVSEGDTYAIYEQITSKLKKLIDFQHETSIKKTDEMQESFIFLQTVSRLLGALLVIGGILIAFFTVRSIVQPVNQLKKMLVSMGIGVLPKERINQRNDEIGEMGEALNNLIDGMESTTQFAKEVGSGNFFSEYKPLSNQDSLGTALLKMREDLHTNEQILEAKVIERTEEVVRQKEEISKQNEKLEILYKHVTDSIRYAKRLQDAILPPANHIEKILPNSFVLFKPKDIVSGDFYWMSEKAGKTIFAAVDCTGHGVPGAFMSIVGHNLLKHVLNNTNIVEPAIILDELNKGVSETLHQGLDETSTKDGMDISICTIDYKTLELQYAGAFNPLYLVRDGALQQIKANKFPIGFFIDEEKKKFTNHKMQLQKGDCIYLFSDGYADQFGGPNGKKFMVKNFDLLITKIYNKPVAEQKVILDKTIEDWRGTQEQIDDVLVIGVAI